MSERELMSCGECGKRIPVEPQCAACCRSFCSLCDHKARWDCADIIERDTRIAALEAQVAELEAVAPDGIALLDKLRLLLAVEGYFGEGDYAVMDRLSLALEQIGD